MKPTVTRTAVFHCRFCRKIHIEKETMTVKEASVRSPFPVIYKYFVCNACGKTDNFVNLQQRHKFNNHRCKHPIDYLFEPIDS